MGPQHFLDWDKPLSQQPENVRKALERDWLAHPVDHANQSGREIYNATAGGAIKSAHVGADGNYMPLPNKFNEFALASKALKDAGIPGIRYLDAGSRATSGGELLDVFQDAAGKWRSKVKVTNRGGQGFMAPTDSVTTSMPFDSADAARNWAQDKINAGTANYVVFDDAIIELLKRNGIDIPKGK